MCWRINLRSAWHGRKRQPQEVEVDVRWVSGWTRPGSCHTTPSPPPLCLQIGVLPSSSLSTSGFCPQSQRTPAPYLILVLHVTISTYSYSTLLICPYVYYSQVSFLVFFLAFIILQLLEMCHKSTCCKKKPKDQNYLCRLHVATYIAETGLLLSIILCFLLACWYRTPTLTCFDHYQ